MASVYKERTRFPVESEEENLHKYKDEVEKIQAKLKETGSTWDDNFIRRQLDDWKRHDLNIGVFGRTKSGKSSFINVIRGLKDTDVGAAAVDVVECTHTATSYEHPDNPKLKIWDLPGVGTLSHPKDVFLEKNEFDKFDFFLIFSRDGFTELETWLSGKIQGAKKKFYYVRSKVDIAIRNDKRDYPDTHDAGNVLTKIKSDCKKQIKTTDKTPFEDVFLISNKDPHLYDFPALVNKLTANFPSLKRDALIISLSAFDSKEMLNQKREICRRRTLYISSLSAAAAAVPLPGLGAGVDIAIIGEEMTFYRKQFRLNDEAIKERAASLNITVEMLKLQFGLRSVIDITVKTLACVAIGLASSTVLENVLRIALPVVGSALAAGVSYVTTMRILRKLIDMTYEDAIQLSDAMAKKSGFDMKDQRAIDSSFIRSVAVLGEMGTGKSSLVNALRGLKAADPGAAEVGFVETTLERKCYTFPVEKGELYELWDLPAASSILCYECDRIPYPRDCQYIRDCGSNEACYTEQVVTSTGVVFYYSGCQSVDRCQAQPTMNGVTDDETHDVKTCEECCHSDFCNSKGCNSQGLPERPARGPVCFSCNQAAQPDTCDIVAVCDVDELCYLGLSQYGSGDLLYEAKCEPKTSCDRQYADVIPVVGKRNLNCMGCCDSDYCNRNCSSLTYRPAPPTTQIPTPSKHPPTTQQPTSTLTSTTKAVPTTRATTEATTTYKPSTQVPTTRPTTPTPTTPTTTTTTTTTTLKTTTPAPTTPSPGDFCRGHGYQYVDTLRRCVKVVSDKFVTFEMASLTCFAEGGNLLTLRSDTELHYVQNVAKSLTTNIQTIAYYVGASDLQTEGTWLWSDGTPVDHALFHPAQPDNAYGAEDCAVVNGWWTDQLVKLNDVTCSTLANYICELSVPGIPQTGHNLAEDLCRSMGYVYMEGVGLCLKVYRDDYKTYDEASQQCFQDGGHLINIKTGTDDLFLSGLIKHMRDQSLGELWIGASDRLTEGSWFWTDGSSVDRALFALGEPNNHGTGEDCGLLSVSLSVPFPFPANYRDMHFNDKPCSNKLHFVCELDLQAFVPLSAPPGSLAVCRNGDYREMPGTGICYRVRNDRTANYLQARDICKQDGADLMILRDRAMEGYFQNLHFNDHNNEHRYILGALRTSDVNLPTSFQWLDGQSLDPNLAWTVDEPNNYQQQESCLSFTYSPVDRKFALNDINCAIEYYFICEEKCTSADYTYVPVLDLCLKVHVDQKSWTEANHSCNVEGGTLMELTSSAGLAFMKQYLGKYFSGFDSVWLGAKYSSTYHTYRWIHAQKYIPVSYWPGGVPVDHVQQGDCVAFQSDVHTSSKQLGAMDCHAHAHYVCQKP